MRESWLSIHWEIMENSKKKTEQETERRQHHVLVCISASPTSRTVIRTASASVSAYGCRFSALYVKTELDEKNREQLQENLDFAKSCGAKIFVLERNSVQEINAFASNSGITDIYIGKSGSRRSIMRKGTMMERLVHALPGARLHVVPDEDVVLQPSRIMRQNTPRFNIRDILITIGVMAIATIISLLVFESDINNANIVTIYILAVLVAAVLTADRIYGIVAALLYILVFNLLFVEPYYSLRVAGGYMVTYLVTMVSAILTGTLASRMKYSMAVANENATQTRVLLECSELLQHAHTEEDIITTVADQLVRVLKRAIIYYPVEDSELKEPLYFYMDNSSFDEASSSEIAKWVLDYNHHAGAYTSHFSSAKYRYLAIRVGENIYGIIGIRMEHRLSDFENNILLSLVGECGMTIENMRNIKKKERAEAAAENERFRANILRSISHDLRTPLTSISGNATTLLKNEASLEPAQKRQIYNDINEDAQWLNSLVENLLALTKLENVKNLHLTTEVLQEVVEEALRHVDPHKDEHTIIVDETDEVFLVHIDARLIIQVIINLVNNAIKYTPKGSVIRIVQRRLCDRIAVYVIDDGPGVPEDMKPHLFEMFATCHNTVADARRSLGLGLSLCKSIMDAHGEAIMCIDNEPHGSKFIFTMQEVKK